MPSLPRVTAATLDATLTGVGRARRPKLSGGITVDGVRAPVEVLRDRWGVPHLYAQSVPDLLFAQGFVHAQDRLWQMDFQRRVVAGRLAEVLGPELLETDRATRVLGMYRVAQAEVGMLSAEGRAGLEAYAAGVNAAMRRQPLPVEFTLLRYRARALAAGGFAVLGEDAVVGAVDQLGDGAGARPAGRGAGAGAGGRARAAHAGSDRDGEPSGAGPSFDSVPAGAASKADARSGWPWPCGPVPAGRRCG